MIVGDIRVVDSRNAPVTALCGDKLAKRIPGNPLNIMMVIRNNMNTFGWNIAMSNNTERY